MCRASRGKSGGSARLKGQGAVMKESETVEANSERIAGREIVVKR